MQFVSLRRGEESFRHLQTPYQSFAQRAQDSSPDYEVQWSLSSNLFLSFNSLSSIVAYQNLSSLLKMMYASNSTYNLLCLGMYLLSKVKIEILFLIETII